MGGALALAAASKFSKVSAVAPFYGLPNPENYDLSSIACPVQGHYAEIDDWISAERVEKELKQKVKTDQEVYIYSGVHHAFTNEARPEVFDHKTTEVSLDRTLVFFAKHLF